MTFFPSTINKHVFSIYIYYAGIFQTSADKLDVDGGRGEGIHNAKQASYRKCKIFKISQNTLRQT